MKRHRREPFLADLEQPRQSARALGYRLPAEWVPAERVWLTRPANVETWPGESMERAQGQWEAFASALRAVVEVATPAQLTAAGPRGAPTTDAWIRDYGPIFVTRPDGPPGQRKACHDFIFDGWGGKYEPKDDDDVVPQHIARAYGLPLWVHDLVLEGGSIDVNGEGVLLTTEQCLLNRNRNPHLGRAQIEELLRESFAVERIVWLPGGIAGDDTDGHVDDIARFLAPGLIAAPQAPQAHPDHAILEGNWSALAEARDLAGRPFELLPLPVPEPIDYHFPPSRFEPGGRAQLPASYANFLIVNGSLFLPVFGQRSDEEAIRVLERAAPYRMVPIPADHLVIGMGALHCLSMQEPA